MRDQRLDLSRSNFRSSQVNSKKSSLEKSISGSSKRIDSFPVDAEQLKSRKSSHDIGKEYLKFSQAGINMLAPVTENLDEMKGTVFFESKNKIESGKFSEQSDGLRQVSSGSGEKGNIVSDQLEESILEDENMQSG